ncbi:MAG: multicopper oxidase domain-containing protein [Actinobacteria bacterium]|nr:multicopper oxidase domain-containing protein [Actinomycetota bacterium]
MSDMSDSAKVKLVWPVAGFFVVVAFGVGLVSMAAFDSNQRRAEPGTTPVAGTSPSANSVDVELGELYIEPDELEVGAGEVTFNVKNEGSAEHNFAIVDAGARTPIIPGGGSDGFTADLEPGTYGFMCEVAGHAEGGMKGTLTVTEGSDTSNGEHGSHGVGATTMSPQEMVRHDAEVTGSFPASTKGTGGVDLEPRMEDGVKVFQLTADEITWEVAPGETKQGFAYNGMIPGPAIRAELGDRVRVILHNELDNEPTTIHFHGMTVPNEMDGVPVINQRAVMPGKSFTYEFTVRNSGTNMYHSIPRIPRSIRTSTWSSTTVHSVSPSTGRASRPLRRSPSGGARRSVSGT